MRTWLALALVAAACSSPARPPGPAIVTPARAPVAARTPRPAEPGFIGVIAAHAQVEVSFPVAARLARVYVRLGDEVDAGTVVADLDATELDSDIAGADGGLRESEAEGHQAVASWRQAHAHTKQVRRLFVAGGISPQEKADAAFDEDRARAAVERARSITDERRAALVKLQQLRARTQLRSPVAGRVVARGYDEGALVPATTAVVTIGSSARDARFAVPPERRDAIALGRDVVVVAPGGHCWHAPVSEIAPAVDTAMQMGVAAAAFADPAGLPPPGTRVTVLPASAAAAAACPR